MKNFKKACLAITLCGENNFASALQTDRVVAMILAESGGGAGPTSGLTSSAPPAKSWLSRIFGL